MQPNALEPPREDVPSLTLTVDHQNGALLREVRLDVGVRGRSPRERHGTSANNRQHKEQNFACSISHGCSPFGEMLTSGGALAAHLKIVKYSRIVMCRG